VKRFRVWLALTILPRDTVIAWNLLIDDGTLVVSNNAYLRQNIITGHGGPGPAVRVEGPS